MMDTERESENDGVIIPGLAAFPFWFVSLPFFGLCQIGSEMPFYRAFWGWALLWLGIGLAIQAFSSALPNASHRTSVTTYAARYVMAVVVVAAACFVSGWIS